MKKIILAGALILASTTASANFFKGSLVQINRVPGGSFAAVGGEGVSSASDSYNETFGSAQGNADANLTASNFLNFMELDALSRSTSTRAVNISTYGIQRYRYTGATSTNITATGTFRGSLNTTNTARITGRMAVISAVGDMDGMIDDFEDTSLWTDLFGVGEHSASRLASGQVQASNNLSGGFNGPGNKNMPISLSFSVNPNDEFFVYGILLTHGSGGGRADAHALSSTAQGAHFSLTGTSDLTPVPVPAAVWLMGSALLGLLGFKRRKT